jgi:hypothetical protein
MRMILVSVVGVGLAATVWTAQPPTNGCKPSNPTSVTVIAGTLYWCSADETWTPLDVGGAGGGLPVGAIMLIASGTCPAGYAEATALNGKMLRGTVAANGNVGTTGGSDAITPTVASLTAAAQTFTGSSVTSSAVSGGTPAGTNGTGTVTATGTIAWPAGVPTHSGTAATFAGNALATHAHELPWQIPSTTTIRQIAVATFGTGTSRAATAVSAAGTANTTAAAVALSQGVSAGTPAGSVTISNQGAVAWPAGVPVFSGSSATTTAEIFTGNLLGTHQHTVTATGTNGTSAVTGTLNSFDNRPAYLNVIFCQKT